MADIECKIEIPAIPGLPDNELTVGREFILSCSGNFPHDLVQEKLQFVLADEQKYEIHLLGFEFRSPTQADLKVTAYQAIPVKLDNLKLSDGTHTVDLGPVQFPVKSVIEKPAPSQNGEQPAKQEPYGPIGPASVPVPTLYIAIALSLLGLVILFFVFKIIHAVQRRKMLLALRDHDSALSPLAQFHQSMRKLQRENSIFFGGIEPEQAHFLPALNELHRMLKLYLTRQYQVPALEWSDRLILRDLKKYHKNLFNAHGVELKQLLKEYVRAFQDRNSLKAQDLLVLSQRTRRLVEEMERVS